MVPDADPSEGAEREAASETDCCKVGRTAAAFDVADAVVELADRRAAGHSFRDLAAYFNTRVVERALERSAVEDGRSVHAALVGDDVADDVYRVLRGDGESDIRRAEVRARLSEAGVDVERLESSFVSHVTVRSHSRDCVGVEPDESPPPFEQIVNTTQGARTRASNVVQSSLDRAVRHGHLETGRLEAEVPVRVTCTECGDAFYLTELLNRRRCSCATTGRSDG